MDSIRQIGCYRKSDPTDRDIDGSKDTAGSSIEDPPLEHLCY